MDRLWRARAPRERVVLAVLGVLVVVVCYAWLLHAAGIARARLATSVTALRTQSALLGQQAAEYNRLRAQPAGAAASSDLRALVQARANAAGHAASLTRLEAPDAEHVRLTFGAIAFADWLAWVAALQAQHVRLETARIEALAAPGLVSVTATFARAGAR